MAPIIKMIVKFKFTLEQNIEMNEWRFDLAMGLDHAFYSKVSIKLYYHSGKYLIAAVKISMLC